MLQDVTNNNLIIAVVIPCYRVKQHILRVIDSIRSDVSHIFIIDDKCPEGSGRFVHENAKDPRITVLYHEINKGVGGAVVSGYRAALSVGADIVIKIDGDGQMDPHLIPDFVAPIVLGEADYCKGNRFHTAYGVRQMPPIRMFGNTMLSFMTKLSSGYWSIFDPTNGYTAINANALRALDLHHLSERYFFESDLLIRLSAIRAMVADVPMEAVYGDESSGLKISRIFSEFLTKHLHAILRRTIYFYFLRDFNLASLNLLFGLPMLMFGTAYGAIHWWLSVSTGVLATTGTVMLAVLPIAIGFQMILFFLGYDITNEPKRPLNRRHKSALPIGIDRTGTEQNSASSATPRDK